MSIKKLFALPLSICLTLSMLSFASVPVSAKDTLDRTGEALIQPPKAQLFTPTYSKKGLQFGESIDDAINLGIKYCLFNIEITELMDTSGNRLEYDYNGKTYTFNWDAFKRWGSLFSQLEESLSGRRKHCGLFKVDCGYLYGCHR